MTDPVQALLQVGLEVDRFPPNSRYRGIDVAQLETNGALVPYLRRRFVPGPERFDTIGEHTVAAGDRLDNLTAHYLGDPELFWRLCDANNALHPEELTDTVGRRLRLTLPEGIPGAAGA